MPSRIQPAMSLAIAAAISTCATLRRIRSRSERIFAITGSAEMPSAVPMNSANTKRSVVAADERVGQREAERDAREHGEHEAADRDARGGAAEAADQRGIGLEPGQDQQQEHADPRRAREQRALERVVREQPVVECRREVAEHARPEQQSGRELADHRGLPDRAQHAAERARGEQQREQLEPEQQELVFGGHRGPYASFARSESGSATHENPLTITRARAEIRNTIARYTWCGDFGDVDGFVACFTEDAVLTVKDGPVFEGHAGLRRLASGEGSRAPARASRRGRSAAPSRLERAHRAGVEAARLRVGVFSRARTPRAGPLGSLCGRARAGGRALAAAPPPRERRWCRARLGSLSGRPRGGDDDLGPET